MASGNSNGTGVLLKFNSWEGIKMKVVQLTQQLFLTLSVNHYTENNNILQLLSDVLKQNTNQQKLWSTMSLFLGKLIKF